MPRFQNDPVLSVNHDVADQAQPAVQAVSARVSGVWGQSGQWIGVYGRSDSGGWGVYGEGPVGVAGVGQTWIGVYGETKGTMNGPSGVLGEGGPMGVGVKGHSSGPGIAGVAGYSLTSRGPGIFGQGSPAGQFNGDVNVTGTLNVGVDVRLVNGDCAEEFDVELGPIEPGTVVVLSDGGRLLPSADAYDKRVAGVVSGAGGYRPGLTLDAQDAATERVPVALMGKVYCRVDAESAPIQTGDMLTTATTPGHAMKATDITRAFGAVIGKALGSLTTGKGLIPILVTLQ
jgi:hypothetical protein